VGDPIQPVDKQFSGGNRRRPADEDKESGLKGVLGIVLIPEDTAADTPDHRTVTPHQSREGSFIPMLDKAPEELGIGQSSAIQELHSPAQLLDDLARPARHHVPPSAVRIGRPLSTICRTTSV